MGKLDQIYRHLPIPLQHASVTAFGTYWWWQRFGPGYRAMVREFESRDHYSVDEWRSWQERRLREVLSGAADRVPHYREVWSSGERLAARSGDLMSLPLLEKEPLREDPTRFLDPDLAPRRPMVFATSGSTGTPISTYWTAQELRRSMALREARSARWAGVSFAQPRATFSGRIVEPDPDSTGPFYRYNAVERQIYLSAFHLSPRTAPVYAAGFRRHHIRWATGYAVSYSLLAKYLLEQGQPLDGLDAVITTSEKLTDEMRDVIRAGLGCRAFEEYSTVENVLFASECTEGSLHVSPDAGVVEILRADGSPASAGEVGEVVATCLLRSYQPFIRFRLGDLASWSDEPCPCGRMMPVIREVVGRLEDVVTGPDGRQLVRFHGIFVNMPNVVEGQVVQETRTDFTVRVVATGAFSEADRVEIAERMHQRLGPGAHVTVSEVAALERTAAGKVRSVISRVEEL